MHIQYCSCGLYWLPGTLNVIPLNCGLIWIPYTYCSCGLNWLPGTLNGIRYTTQLRFNSNCSSVLSNLYVLGGRAFLTSIDTQCFLSSWSHKYLNLPFLMYTQLYSILCVSQRKYFSPHFLDQLKKQGRHCRREGREDCCQHRGWG